MYDKRRLWGEVQELEDVEIMTVAPHCEAVDTIYSLSQ